MADCSPTQKVSEDIPERSSTIPLEIDKSQEVWGKLVSLNKLPSFDMIGKRTITIGRSEACDLVISDSFISSKHCVITVKENDPEYKDGIYVKDTSTNGTYVNRQRLEKNKFTLLENGSELILVLQQNIPGNYIAGYIFQDLLFRFTKRLDLLAIEDQDPLRSRYTIMRELGRGHFGIVSLAVEKSTGDAYAVKEIDVKRYDAEKRKQFIVEAQFYDRLHHSCFPQLKEIIETKDMIYIVMELVTGGDLFDRIIEKKHYQEKEARQLMINLLGAVRYLHNQDIVHRDLKPENILLAYKGDDVSIKITDFGLAKHIDQNGLKTYCGTPQYFAPEVLKRRDSVSGTGRYGKPVDMWSVGVILYFMLSGKLPFDQDDLSQEVRHALFSFKEPIWDTISQSAKDLIERLLDVDPTTRITVDQALHHPWITNMPFIPSSLPPSEVEAPSQVFPSEEKSKNPFLCDSILSPELEYQYSQKKENNPLKFSIVKQESPARKTSSPSHEEVMKNKKNDLSKMEGDPDNPYYDKEHSNMNSSIDERESFFLMNNMVNIYKAPSYVNQKRKSQKNSNEEMKGKRIQEEEEMERKKQKEEEFVAFEEEPVMKPPKPVTRTKRPRKSPKKENGAGKIRDYFKQVEPNEKQQKDELASYQTPSKVPLPVLSKNIVDLIQLNSPDEVIPSSMSPENQVKRNSMFDLILAKQNEKHQQNGQQVVESEDLSDTSNTLPCQLKDGSGSAPQVTAFTSALLKPNPPADSSISLFQKQIK